MSVMASSIFHPAFSQLKHLTSAEITIVHEFVVDEMIALHVDEEVINVADTDDEVITVLSPKKKEMLEALFGDDDDDEDEHAGSDLDESAIATQLKLRCISELKRYLSHSKHYRRAEKGSCSLLWWSVNRHTFKLLAPAARKWLGVLCSSVPSERAFSCSGNMVTSRRAALGGDLVCYLVFLNKNKNL